MTDRPCVLVALPLRGERELLAEGLARKRPAYEVRPVAPEALATALEAGSPPIAICGDEVPSSLPFRARGWIVLHPSGQNAALVGVGDAWRTLKRPGLADLLAALDGLVARTAPPPPVPCPA
jgi:hypothetical protein